MALKADREILAEELGYYVNEVAERGNVVCYKTAGSGVALDSVSNVAGVAATASGNKPIGFLLTEFVNVDLTRFQVNWHRDQANSGDKAAILTKGWVNTNRIAAGAGAANAGDFAVLSDAGVVSGVAPGAAWNEAATPKIGRFRTKVDQNGYARIEVDL